MTKINRKKIIQKNTKTHEMEYNQNKAKHLFFKKSKKQHCKRKHICFGAHVDGKKIAFDLAP